LHAWNLLPPAERQPGAVRIEDRGPCDPARSVAPPPGGLILRGFLRQMQRDQQGQLYAPSKRSELLAGGKRYQILEEPNRDYLWLTRAEWKSLIPKNPREGDRFALPPSIRERLLRFHLVDAARGLAGCWQPKQVRAAVINLLVTEVSPSVVRLRLEGGAVLADKPDRTQAKSKAEIGLLGYLDYDPKACSFTRFDILALGPFQGTRGDGQGVHGGPKEVRIMLGFAFELVPGDPTANFVPPRGTRLETGSNKSLDDYFRGAPGLIRATSSQ